MKVSSPVEVCNLALMLIKQRTISSLDDASVQGKMCKMIYEHAKTYLLSQYEWSFATKNVVLNKVSDNSGLKDGDKGYDKELMGYNRKFVFPEGFLRLICILDEYNYPVHNTPLGIPIYLVENLFVITDLKICKMKYVADMDTVAKFSPQFIECLILDIAIRLSKLLTDSTAYKQTLEADFQRAFAAAKISDCRQGLIYSRKESPLAATYMEF